jgi:hypothetical protein
MYGELETSVFLPVASSNALMRSALGDRPVISVASRGRKREVNAWYRPAVWSDVSDELLDSLIGPDENGKREVTRHAEIVVAAELLREDPVQIAAELARCMYCHYLAATGYALDVPGETNYYSAAWSDLAPRFLCTAERSEQKNKGWSKLTPTDEFRATVGPLLRPDAFDMARDGSPVGTAGSRMFKYRCACTTVRCATRLNATCASCGTFFVWEDKAAIPARFIGTEARTAYVNPDGTMKGGE